nr:membrane protein insertase YidC [Cumulibacter manganitolerans]
MNLDFLYYPIAWVLKLWHQLWGGVFGSHSGASWVLAIMFLVFTVRILLFPLFVKMIKSQRAMQELQPEISKLRAEYGSDRQGMSEAMMKLQKERGVNPLAGCMPMIIQAPVFIALLHVLRRLEPGKPGLYSWDSALTQNAATAQVFGAPISSFFTMSGVKLQKIIDATGTTSTTIKMVTGVLIVVMAITQFITTKQIMKRTKAQNAALADNPQASQMELVQKLMLYGAPLGLLVSGTFFPLGVLLYWFFNNLWTIGQQFWVLKRMPAPGARAAAAKADVDRSKLAPRPGAKPAKTKIVKPAGAAEPDAEAEPVPIADDKPADTAARPSAAAKPAPGARPAGRPPAKRKKR